MKYLDVRELLDRISITFDEKETVTISGYDGYDSMARLISVKFSKKTLKTLLALLSKKYIK